MNALSICSLVLVVACAQGQGYNARCPVNQCSNMPRPFQSIGGDQCVSDVTCCQGKACCPDPLRNCMLSCLPMDVAVVLVDGHRHANCPPLHQTVGLNGGRCPPRGRTDIPCTYPYHDKCQQFDMAASCCPDKLCGDYCVSPNTIGGIAGAGPRY